MKIIGFHVVQKHGRYYLRRFLSGGKERWEPLTRVDAGEPALLRALAAIRAAADQRAREGNVPTLLAEYRSTLTLTPAVDKEYARIYSALARRLAEFDADQVAPKVILEILKPLATKATMRRAVKARLSQFFGWCVITGHCAVNPCREIRLPEPPKRRGRLNAGAFWQIHDRLPEKWQCFMALMYLTRQRSTEIRLLRESAIGPERVSFVPSKTRSSSGEVVEVVLTPEIRDELTRARSIRDEERRRRERRAKVVAIDRGDELLFTARRGRPYTRWGLRCAWDDARRASGLEGVTSKDVRPFSLAEMERAGYSLDEIRKAAAHSTTTMTEHYLNQHRERVSAARLQMPERKK